MTFADIQTRVESNVIDLPSAVVANVPTYINRVIRSAERKYNFKYMEQSATFVTTTLLTSLTNQDGVSGSTIKNFKEFLGRGPYLLQQNANAKQLYVVNEDREALQTFTLNTSYPDAPQFIELSSLDLNQTATFLVYPYPDTNSDWNDGNYRIIIPYNAYSAPLVSGGDTNWLVVNADDYIEEAASALAFQANHDYQNMQIWQKMATDHWNEIKLADKRRRLSGTDTLVPQFDGANQGMTPDSSGIGKFGTF